MSEAPEVPIDTGTPDPVAPEGGAPAPVAPADWRDGFSPDIASNPVTQRLGSAEAAMKELIGVQNLIGGEKIPRPKDDWTDEQRGDFYNQIGRPADAKDYDFTNVAVPEGLPVAEGLQDSIVAVMHAEGLSQKQVVGVLNAYYGMQGDAFAAQQTDINQSVEGDTQTLRNEWGKSYDGKVDMAKRALVAGAGENADAMLGLKMEGGGLFGDNPLVIRMLAAFGERMSEHGLPGAGVVNTTKTPGEAEAELNGLMGDDDFMKKLLTKGHPEHKMAVQLRSDLMAAADG